MQPKGVIDFDDLKKNRSEEEKSPRQQGHEDFLKETAKDDEKSAQKLDDLTKLADLVLFKTKTANPIDLFPDELIIDVNKVSVIHNIFFHSARVHSVMIKDISDVFIDTGFFWSKLSIVDAGFIENSVDVKFLTNEDAKIARRIIQGLIVAQQQEINLIKLRQDMNDSVLIEKIEALGKARIGD